MKHVLANHTPRWTRRKDARPQELLESALAVFSEKGFSGARLEDVAKNAGVSKGTVYLYYPNKEELLKAVVLEHVSPIVTEAAEQVDESESSTTQIREAIHLWWARYGSTELSALTKIVMFEAHAFPELGQFFHQKVITPWWNFLESLLQRGIRRGEFSDIDTEYAAKVLCAPLVTLSLWKRTMDPCCNLDTDPLRYIEAHIQMVLNGLTCPKNRSSNRPPSAQTGAAALPGADSESASVFTLPVPPRL